MSKDKKVARERIVIDHKKLDKLRKSLTRTIDDFKQSVLESLEEPELGPLKEKLRQDVLEVEVAPQVEAVKEVELPAELGLEKWVAQGMEREVDAPKVEKPAPFIHIVTPVISERTGIISLEAVEEWVAQTEQVPLVAAPLGISVKEDSMIADVKRLEAQFRAAHVHVFFSGLDNLASSNIRNFLQKTGMRTFLPALEGQGSRSIVENFQEYNDFEFAVVVLSADEFMFQRIQDPKNALLVASQKTVYELGFLVGKLGRNRVAVFYEDADKFKRPTEYFDLNYIPFDAQGQWQGQLIRQMQTAGIVVKEEAVVNA